MNDEKKDSGLGNNYVEIMGIDITAPTLRSKGSETHITMHLRSYIIDRMTLSKISLIDKVKMELSSDNEHTVVEAINFRLNIFPETMRELTRISDIIKTS
jgi:hypothetical protein